jgi:hypothetical protein
MEIQNSKIQGIKGYFCIIKTDKDGNEISRTKIQPNMVVDNTNNGFDLIMQRLYGDNTYSLNITYLEIGDGDTAPTLADTTLENSVARTAVATKQRIGTTIVFRFFFADGDLANGTYNEVSLWVDGSATIETGAMFTRALFGAPYTKATGENTTIEYIVSKE